MPNDEWMTPPEIFDHWYQEYGPFDLDAAASEENTFCSVWIDKEQDALGSAPWTDYLLARRPGHGNGQKAWCNPPYSRAAGPLARWVDRFYAESEQGWEITALLPADTSTRWFRQLWNNKFQKWHPGITGHFLPRIRFIDPATGRRAGSPKFGSLLIHFDPW